MITAGNNGSSSHGSIFSSVNGTEGPSFQPGPTASVTKATSTSEIGAGSFEFASRHAHVGSQQNPEQHSNTSHERGTPTPGLTGEKKIPQSWSKRLLQDNRPTDKGHSLRSN